MKPVSMRWTGLALALGLALIVTTDAQAYKPKPKHKSKGRAVAAKVFTGAESGLIGIKLYDSGMRVLDVYGTPDSIESLSGGTTMSAGGGAGAGAGAGAPGGGGMPPGLPGVPGGGMGRGRTGGGGGGASSADNRMNDDFAFGDTVLMQRGKGGGFGMAGAGGDPNPNFGAPPGSGGMRGGPPGMTGPGGPGGPGGAGGTGAGVPGTNGGAADRVTFTRWVYNREGSKYAFIIDKQGRVVQIEAIGLDNSRVKTKRGIGFGTTFAGVMKTYQQPDGYEIAGDNLTIKYLVHDNVAFRLSRLGTKKPQVVTGIVVAAGKS